MMFLKLRVIEQNYLAICVIVLRDCCVGYENVLRLDENTRNCSKISDSSCLLKRVCIGSYVDI